jgi:hypothetical protein
VTKTGKNVLPSSRIMNGLSLAMNSAPSDITNRNKKIHSEMNPRRLALKFCQRRWLIGDSQRRFGATATPSGGATVPG